jgi:hypothetical protein
LRLGIFTEVTTDITVSWDVILCIVADHYQCFQGTCCLQLHFPEDGVSRLNQNVDINLPDYTTTQHKDNKLHSYCCENPRSHLGDIVYVG